MKRSLARLLLIALPASLLFAARTGAQTAPAATPAAPATTPPAAESPLAKSYPIKLHRPLTPGGLYDVEIASNQTRTRANPATPTAFPLIESSKYNLIAKMKVSQVNSIGTPRAMTLTITQLTNDVGTALVEPGATIDIVRGEKTTTCSRPGGALLTPNAVSALQTMYFPFPEPDISDDDSFGTATPRRVGDYWPINADTLRNGWVRMGWKIDPGVLIGETKFDGLETVRDIPMLRINTAMTWKNSTPPGFPIDMAVMGSDFRSRMIATVPVEVSSQASIKDMTEDSVIHLRSATMPVAWDLTIHTSQKETIIPAKP